MGYAGQTFRIPLGNCSFRPGANYKALRPEDLTVCRNLDFVNDGLETRGGTAKINTTALSGAPSGRGGFDYQLTASSFKVFATSDGKLWKDTSNTIKTGMSTANYFSFGVFGGELYVCDGDTTPQTWAGSGGTSNLTTPAADWSGTNQPFQCLAHARGESRRMYFLYGSAVYYSILGNGKDLTGTGSGKITLDIQDGKGLTGGVEFGNRLILFSRNKSYIITDSSSDTAHWGYVGAQWEGGAAHWRVVCKTPTDLLIMTDSGEIYSITTAQNYGDYAAASITKPSYIDRWIRENVDLQYIEKFHSCYDFKQRCARFWVVRNGQTAPDTCLKFYIDRPADKAWAIDDNQQSDSGFSAACAFSAKDSDGIYRVYTVDFSGFQWKLGEDNTNDEDNSYYSGFKLAPQYMGNPRTKKHFKRFFASMRHKGEHSVNVKIYVDNSLLGTAEISADGDLLNFTLTFPATFGEENLLERKGEIGFFGKWLELEFYTSGVNQGFYCGEVLVDFKVNGAELN